MLYGAEKAAFDDDFLSIDDPTHGPCALLCPGNHRSRKEQLMPVGTVKFFNTDKGYGFIQPDNGGTDSFVHISAVQAAGMATLERDQRDTFSKCHSDNWHRQRGHLRSKSASACVEARIFRNAAHCLHAHPGSDYAIGSRTRRDGARTLARCVTGSEPTTGIGHLRGKMARIARNMAA